MHLRTLKIKNFRALADINVEFDKRVNVIVGPNAVGKTTVMEAIRLAKAMLAPRTANESMQTLIALGAASPHIPNRLRLEAIARDPLQPIVISCRYEISAQELTNLNLGGEQIAESIVQSRLGQNFAHPGALIGFLSSPEGKQQLLLASTEIKHALDRINVAKQCLLELITDVTQLVELRPL